MLDTGVDAKISQANKISPVLVLRETTVLISKLSEFLFASAGTQVNNPINQTCMSVTWSKNPSS